MTWTQCKHGGQSPAEVALSGALTAARARIAELEDWQRRALEWMRAEVAGDMSVRCGCARCAERMRLVEEATR